MTHLIWLAALSLMGQDAVPRDWKEWLEQGELEFYQYHLGEALAAFQKAADLNPNDVQVRLALAFAYDELAKSREDHSSSQADFDKAAAEFRRALEIQPDNSKAIQFLYLYNRMFAPESTRDERLKKYGEVRQWLLRLLASEDYPLKSDVYRTLAEAARETVKSERNAARASLHRSPTDLSPLPLPVRQEIGRAYEPVFSQAFIDLQQAMQLDPDDAEAMERMANLFQERAALRDSPQESARDIAEGEQWAERSVAARERKLAAKRSAPEPLELSEDDTRGQLVKRVEPVCPALARRRNSRGSVRFKITISPEGEVISVQPGGGESLFQGPALHAVMQWTYQPVISNGTAVAVTR